MDSPVQDDPYLSLGVGKHASAAEIKSAYRRLALQCHPDKVTDEALKAQKADEFHRVQQAYEILQDDEKRGRYDARARLAELKAEMLRREGARGGDVRPPPPMSYASFTAAPRYDYRTPRYAEDYAPEPRSATRKHSDAGAYSRRTSSASVRTEEKKRSDKEDKIRSERRRARDADIRDSRDRKYYAAPENVEERSYFEAERRRRDDVVKQHEERRADDLRRETMAEEARRRWAAENVRAPDAPVHDAPVFGDVKWSAYYNEARRYMDEANVRPQPVRTSSGHYYGEVRRSRVKGDGGRRRSPEIVEPPNLTKSASTGNRDRLREMAAEARMPTRSYSQDITAESQTRHPPPPPRRAETMPTVHTTKDAKPAKARPDPYPMDSGYSSSSPVSPDISYPLRPTLNTNTSSRTTSYRVTPTGEYPTASPVDAYASPTYNFDTRSPKADKDRDMRRARNPSVELPRPPMGAGSRTYTAPATPRDELQPPPRRPSYTTRVSDTDVNRETRRRARTGAGDDGLLFNEIPSDGAKKGSARGRDYKVSAGRYDGREREYATRPVLNRSKTVAGRA